jgi:hypothetical protein
MMLFNNPPKGFRKEKGLLPSNSSYDGDAISIHSIRHYLLFIRLNKEN